MKSRGHSQTAEAMAAIRLLLRRLPPARRTVDDRFAHAFLVGRYQLLLPLARLPRLLGKAIDLLNPGAVSYVAIRHRRFDDELELAAKEGAETVLLLGAGFDTRALRFPDRGLQFIEIDHPNTQATKRRVLERKGWLRQASVRFCSADLETTRLAAVLAEIPVSGRVFVIWEGVAWYLHEDAVRQTLQALSRWAPAGSRLVFDAIDQGVPDGTRDDRTARAHRRYCEGRGEPIRWGTTPEALGPFLASCGWDLGEVTDPRTAARESGIPEPFGAPLPFMFLVRASVA